MKDIYWIQPYYHLILDRVPRMAATFLDVGAGNGIFGFILKKTRECKQLDAIEPFNYELNHFDKVYRMTWKEWLNNPSNYDVIIATEVIEECKRICRSKAFIYTPSEFKDNMDAVDNAWNLGSNPHQEHLCVLSRDDFKTRGYNTRLVIDNGIFAEYIK